MKTITSKKIKIAILGGFNYTYNTHHAINLALNHAIDYLNINCDYFWIKLDEYLALTKEEKNDFDGFWFAPKPFLLPHLINPIIRELIDTNKTTIITDDAFQNFVETIAYTFNIGEENHKNISENILQNNSQFNSCQLIPLNENLKKIYKNIKQFELTSCNFSFYPNFTENIKKDIVEISAIDNHNEPIAIQLRKLKFFLACSFCPQVSSTMEKPHPLIIDFLKASY